MRIKIPEMKKRVAKDPVENQKFYDEIRKMFKEFDEEMLRLAERHIKKSDN